MTYWPYLQTAIPSILSHFQQTIHRKGVCGETNKQDPKRRNTAVKLFIYPSLQEGENSLNRMGHNLHETKTAHPDLYLCKKESSGT